MTEELKVKTQFSSCFPCFAALFLCDGWRVLLDLLTIIDFRFKRVETFLPSGFFYTLWFSRADRTLIRRKKLKEPLSLSGVKGCVVRSFTRTRPLHSLRMILVAGTDGGSSPPPCCSHGPPSGTMNGFLQSMSTENISEAVKIFVRMSTWLRLFQVTLTILITVWSATTPSSPPASFLPKNYGDYPKVNWKSWLY